VDSGGSDSPSLGDNMASPHSGSNRRDRVSTHSRRVTQSLTRGYQKPGTHVNDAFTVCVRKRTIVSFMFFQTSRSRSARDRDLLPAGAHGPSSIGFNKDGPADMDICLADRRRPPDRAPGSRNRLPTRRRPGRRPVQDFVKNFSNPGCWGVDLRKWPCIVEVYVLRCLPRDLPPLPEFPAWPGP
jgi:hypothetical protein